jgi:hypothetical protein
VTNPVHGPHLGPGGRRSLCRCRASTVPLFFEPDWVLSDADDHDVLHGNGKYPLLLGG